MNEENQMLALALKYAGHDLPVFPLYGVNEEGVCDCGKADCTGNSRGKHPITQNGYKDATTDKFQIKSWWKKHPNANIGIATGKDSIVVLDIDGEHGLKSLEALKQHGEIPDTVGVITGKGLHLYFKSDVPVKQSIGTIGDGLDVRSDGGYVVAPSSRHYSGVNYRYEEGKGLGEIEIAEIPDWLITIMNSDKTKNPKNLPMIFNNIIPEHYRNDTLFKHASYLRGKGYGYDEILKSLINMNETKCKPQLKLSYLETIAKQGCQYTPEAMKNKIKNFDIIDSYIEKNDEIKFEDLLQNDSLLNAMAFMANDDSHQFEILIQKMKTAGLTARNEAVLRKTLKSFNKNKQALATVSKDNRVITEFIDNPPVSNSILIPAGYVIDMKGIYEDFNTRNSKAKIVATAPVMISRILVSNDDSELVSIVWYRNGNWKTLTVSRGVIASSHKILELAGQGFPVNSTSAKSMVEYLSLFESINEDYIPRGYITTNMGWIDGGKKGFLVGTKLIPPSGEGKLINADLSVMNKTAWQDGSVFFENNDSGNLVDGFCSKGKLENWKKIVSIINNNDILAFMLYSSVASPLLYLLEQPNFFVDLSGVTTTAKTTALKVAASVFGKPNAIINSWNSTQVYNERTAAILNGLPFFIDDTKLVKDTDFMSKFVYEGASGMGKGRGTSWGTSKTLNWSLVFLSTGESKLTDMVNKNDGGIHGRVISICTPPFEKTTKKNKKIIDELNDITSNNYGKPIFKFIRFLLKNKEISKWKSEIKKISQRYDAKSSQGIINRLNIYFACIHLAARLFNKALRLELDYENHINKIHELVVAEVDKTSDVPLVALKGLHEYCVSHKDEFYNKYQGRAPFSGWIGLWNTNLQIIPNKLDEILIKLGYSEPKSIIREWDRRDWFVKNSGEKGFQRKMTIADERIRCYEIKQKILKSLNSKINH